MTNNSPFEIPFGTLLNYANKGTDQNSLRSKRIVEEHIKRANRQIIDRIAERVLENLQAGGLFSCIFKPESALIPVPGSTKLVKDALWVPLEICKALSARNVGSSIEILLERHTTIRSSHFSKRSERPSIAEHLNTLGPIDPNVSLHPKQIVLIDDVITKGSTICACAILLRQLFPQSQITAFGAARTLGFESTLATIAEPYVNKITWDGSSPSRG